MTPSHEARAASRGTGGIRAVLALALAVGTCAGVAVASAGAAHAARPAAAGATGTILFVSNHNVWATTRDRSVTRQITHNGGQPTANRTGGVGYHAPSAPNNGTLIVAIRNQHYAPGYDQGWVHVMDRNGRGIRTFKPPQFPLMPDNSLSCPVKADQVPRGIIDAMVSPDGRHIVYTALTYEQDWNCNVTNGYSSYLVNINGTGGVRIARGGGDGASIEAGQWVNNTRVLLDDVDFGSTGFWYVDLPSHTAKRWMQSSDPFYIEADFSMPALRGGKMASVGYSNVTSSQALRLWSSSGPPTNPRQLCDLATPVSGGYLDRPTWSPTADAVAFAVDDTNATVRPGEGLYMLPVGTLSRSSCVRPRLLVKGGFDPFWSPAPIT